MNRRELLKTGAAALALGLSRFPMGWAASAHAPKRHLLFYTGSGGFQHSVIARHKPDELSFAERIVTDLGKKHGFEVTCSKEGGMFEPDQIGKFDAFFFYTTGDLTKEGKDNKPPMSPEGKKALLAAINDGKGFVGSHCASDTFHSHGDSHKNQEADQRDPYIAMLGGEFIVHGAQQESLIRVVDPKFPGVGDLKDFELKEEWYALKNFAPDLHVILLQDPKGMKGDMYQRGPFPETWARQHGKGRVFFTSMGHREEVWQTDTFQQVLLGGLAWAFGNVQADVTPNLDKVAPHAMELTAKS